MERLSLALHAHTAGCGFIITSNHRMPHHYCSPGITWDVLQGRAWGTARECLRRWGRGCRAGRGGTTGRSWGLEGGGRCARSWTSQEMRLLTMYTAPRTTSQVLASSSPLSSSVCARLLPYLRYLPTGFWKRFLTLNFCPRPIYSILSLLLTELCW